MRRVCVVVTARPSYSRVKSVLTALKAHPGVQLQIIAAGAALVWRYGQIVDQMRKDGFEITAEVPCVVEGGGTRESVLSTGLLVAQLGTILHGLKPDWVVTIADRHETLATAIAASYQNIPLAHIQGGEVSGSIDDRVRNAVTQLADLHLVATAGARERVLAMRPDAEVQVTGCPSIDLAAQAVSLGPLPGHDVVVLQHPVTTEVEHAGAQMRETIEALRDMDVLWFWPGEDAGADAMSKELRMAGLHPTRNMPPLDFLRTLLGSKVLVGNSSVGIRECSYLGVQVVNVGSRQRGREFGITVVHTDHRSDFIRASVEAALRRRERERSTLYGDGHSGERIASILAGQAKEAVA